VFPMPAQRRLVEGRSAGSPCLVCRGGKMLCGRPNCPALARASASARIRPLMEGDVVQGASPPGVFVGRAGYPRVRAGPMIPPFFGDTSILDAPELWLGKGLEEIVDYRYSLIRGTRRVGVEEAREGGRLISSLQELAMGDGPVDSEAHLLRRPKGPVIFSEYAQPFGPSAPLRSFDISDLKVDRRIERAYYDRDLMAAEAVFDLYEDGVAVTKIQRAFSVGMFGRPPARKLVPTRWSITAIDSSLSARLVGRLKNFETIDNYRVHSFRTLHNLFLAILLPLRWSFEWIEAWFPGSTWNAGGSKPALMGDYEGYGGRKSYASVGGCYYSARLAVAEGLVREGRQAAALVMREIYPGYSMPVGVWLAREGVRRAMASEPREFDSLEGALACARSELEVPLRRWMEHSVILKDAFLQEKLPKYLSRA
jgi:hypothetical protein